MDMKTDMQGRAYRIAAGRRQTFAMLNDCSRGGMIAVTSFRGESHGKFRQDVVCGTLDTTHNTSAANGTPALLCFARL